MSGGTLDLGNGNVAVVWQAVSDLASTCSDAAIESATQVVETVVRLEAAGEAGDATFTRRFDVLKLVVEAEVSNLPTTCAMTLSNVETGESYGTHEILVAGLPIALDAVMQDDAVAAWNDTGCTGVAGLGARTEMLRGLR